MKKCLTSFGYGPQRPNFLKTTGLFSEYAALHSYDYFVSAESRFKEWIKDNPSKGYAWFKIPVLSKLLCIYDVVLWIDADVVIMDNSKDILDEAGSEPMSMAVHDVKKGTHPNTGVWILRKPAKAIIDAMDVETKLPLHLIRWYEQAALHRHFGMDLWKIPLHTPKTDDWGELPYRYNAIKPDVRSIPEDAAFIHAAGFQDVFDEAYQKRTR